MNPFSQISFSVMYIGVAFTAPYPWNMIITLIVFSGSLLFPRGSTGDPAHVFIRIIIFASAVLFSNHLVNYEEFSIDISGIETMAVYISRLLCIMSIIIWLARTVDKEDLFTFFVKMRMPMAVIYLLFTTFWMVPRLARRVNDIVLAQRLRGKNVNSLLQRLRLLSGSFTCLFNSLIIEVLESTIPLDSKGILISKKINPYRLLKWNLADYTSVGLGIALILIEILWMY